MPLSKAFLLELKNFPDLEIQAHRFNTWLTELPTPEATQALHEVLVEAISGVEEARSILNPYLLTRSIGDLLDSDLRESLYETALASGLRLVSALFAHYSPLAREPAIETFRVPELRPDPTKDPITLGERRALAKTPNSRLLEKILLDPDPRVIANLLDNPHVTEKHVLRIASRRPNRAEILNVLARHRKWGLHGEVRRALVFNPHTPPQLSVHSMLGFPKQHLEEVAFDGNLHPFVREIAEDILRILSIPL